LKIRIELMFRLACRFTSYRKPSVPDAAKGCVNVVTNPSVRFVTGNPDHNGPLAVTGFPCAAFTCAPASTANPSIIRTSINTRMAVSFA
jgi:hypothetical protein